MVIRISMKHTDYHPFFAEREKESLRLRVKPSSRIQRAKKGKEKKRGGKGNSHECHVDASLTRGMPRIPTSNVSGIEKEGIDKQKRGGGKGENRQKEKGRDEKNFAFWLGHGRRLPQMRRRGKGSHRCLIPSG